MNKINDLQVRFGRWLTNTSAFLRFLVITTICFGMPAMYVTIVWQVVSSENLWILLWGIPLIIFDFGFIRAPTFVVMGTD